MCSHTNAPPEFKNSKSDVSVITKLLETRVYTMNILKYTLTGYVFFLNGGGER